MGCVAPVVIGAAETTGLLAPAIGVAVLAPAFLPIRSAKEPKKYVVGMALGSMSVFLLSRVTVDVTLAVQVRLGWSTPILVGRGIYWLNRQAAMVKGGFLLLAAVASPVAVWQLWGKDSADRIDGVAAGLFPALVVGLSTYFISSLVYEVVAGPTNGKVILWNVGSMALASAGVGVGLANVARGKKGREFAEGVALGCLGVSLMEICRLALMLPRGGRSAYQPFFGRMASLGALSMGVGASVRALYIRKSFQS